MRTTTADGMWIETRGRIAEVGLTASALAGKPLTKIETVGKGARVKKGGAFLLLTLGKGKGAKEVELDAPITGRIVELEPALAKAVTGVGAIAAAPESTWVVRVEVAGAVEVDEDEDEGDDGDVIEDDGDDD
jgi:glycine cleavage system H lipoate-binding protein